MSIQWLIRSKDNADRLHEFLLRNLSEGRETILEEKEGNRSTRQNAALHALLRRLAGGLNDGGHTVQHPFKPEYESAVGLRCCAKRSFSSRLLRRCMTSPALQS